MDLPQPACQIGDGCFYLQGACLNPVHLGYRIVGRLSAVGSESAGRFHRSGGDFCVASHFIDSASNAFHRHFRCVSLTGQYLGACSHFRHILRDMSGSTGRFVGCLA